MNLELLNFTVILTFYIVKELLTNKLNIKLKEFVYFVF